MEEVEVVTMEVEELAVVVEVKTQQHENSRGLICRDVELCLLCYVKNNFY